MSGIQHRTSLVLPLLAGMALQGACAPEDGPDAGISAEDRLTAAAELARARGEDHESRGGRGEDHESRSGRGRDVWLRLARWYREIYTPPVDFNGDGYADVAAGLYNPFDEQVVVYLGGPSGLPGTPSQVILSPDPSTTLSFRNVSSAGDVNGDGYGDLIVGATSSGGAVYLFLGSASGLSTTPDQVIQAADTGLAGLRAFGGSLAPARDVDLDGYDDVLVRAAGSDLVEGQEGVVFLFRGGPGGLETTPTWTFTETEDHMVGFGRSMTSTFIDGDRYPDLVFTESHKPTEDGASVGTLHVYLGSRRGFSATPDQILSGPDGDFEDYGMKVTQVGDINLDGHGDVLVSEPLANDVDGRAFVYLGTRSGLHPVPGLQLEPPASGGAGAFGWDVSGGGDVDGNGLPDLVVGETDANSNDGEAHAWFGPFFVRPGHSANPRVLTPDASVIGTGESSFGAYFGTQVSLTGDVDGNGIDDFLVGAPWAGSQFQGRLYRFEGASPNTLGASAVQTVDSALSYARLGQSMTR